MTSGSRRPPAPRGSRSEDDWIACIVPAALTVVADDIRAEALCEMGDWFQLASQLGTGERDDIAAQACYDRADRIGGAA